jgi:N-acetyl-alpha-D-glucosaminyl L-malate synthase BshA
VKRFDKKPLDAFKKVIAPNGERIITHASNFRKVKRIHDVIDVFHKIHDKTPCRLLMVGDGPERPEAEEQCRRLNLCDDIRFLGKQHEMEEILAISDLFLLPSEYESFGLSALEAMASGVPVLSTNVGGLPEINVHGVTGYMTDIGAIQKMSEHATHLFKDENLLNTLKANAKNHALQFDIHKIVPEYEALYKRFVNE